MKSSKTSQVEGCIDIVIVPPLIIKNCLPFELMYDVRKENQVEDRFFILAK
jgi:hypothetical protein